MLRNFTEKRRKQPSLSIPIIYLCLEILLMHLLLSLFNWNLDLLEWNIYSYPIFIMWILFSAIKLSIVLKRQKMRH